MYDMMILAEKPSAYKHMISAFGGVSGDFHGQSYLLSHSAGHLFGMMMPVSYSRTKHKPIATKMIKDPTPAKIKRYSSWSDMNSMPWDPDDFTWAKKLIGSFQRKLFNQIKADAKQCKSIVIATDDDPDTKEGDLLGYEIVQAMHWTKPVYRIRFADETKGPLRRALANKKSMKSQSEWGCYKKANARSHFDYLTIPLTRIATYVAKMHGYNTLVNEGRLKSVILVHIYKQLLARKNYVKHPYYEIRFKDSAGHKYARNTRKMSDDQVKQIRHQSVASGKKALASYTPSPIGKVTKRRVTQSPGPLLNLSTLGSRLAGKYKINDVTHTYEKLYEEQYVSYPRTADKKITENDFKQLLPKVDSIAKVVGVDPKLLTHRTLRPKYRIKHEDHGANRPGPNVPSSLSALANKFGQCGADIYKTLAKNYLSIMAEDAVYTKINANLKKYPKFTTSFRIPVKLNWKLVFKPDEKNDNNGSSDMSWTKNPAQPFMYQGANPKPSIPTMKWILRYLQKMNVGTAATQDSTVGALTKSGRNQKLRQRGQKLTMSQSGAISAVLAMDANIGSAKETQKLSKEMNQVMNYQIGTHDLEMDANKLVSHDKQIMLAMGNHLSGLVGKPKGKIARPSHMSKPKATATINGQQVKFNKVWAGHSFTKPELQKLESGQSVNVKDKYGRIVTGKIAKNTYRGHTFYGFTPQSISDPNKATAMIGGKKVQFNKVWAGHQFTDHELSALKQGNQISFHDRRNRLVSGVLAPQSYHGRHFYGFKPLKFSDPNKVTAVIGGKKVQFKKSWGGHTFTPDELTKLKNGDKITFNGKYGPVTGNLAPQVFRGHHYFGFKMLRSGSNKGHDKSNYNSSNRVQGTFKGHHISFKRVWSQHQFTQHEIHELLAGKTIMIDATSRRGKKYSVKGNLAKQSFRGHSFYGFKPHFN